MSHPDISEEIPDLPLRACLISDQKRLEVGGLFSASLASKISSTPLYFSLERFVMVDIPWIVRSVFYFKISIPFPDESSEMFFLLSICVFFH